MWYIVTYTITPYCCNPIKQTAVISESPALFCYRNKRKLSNNTGFTLDMVVECDPCEYELLKPFNPTKEMYEFLKKDDYSK